MNIDYIELTDICECDLPILYEKINDEELVSQSSQFRKISWEEHLEWFKIITSRDDCVLFGIRDVNTGELLGTCQLLDIKKDNSAELRIRVWKQNEGVGTIAMRKLLDFAFNKLNLKYIYLTVFSTNYRARHLYENFGFTSTDEYIINGRNIIEMHLWLWRR